MLCLAQGDILAEYLVGPCVRGFLDVWWFDANVVPQGAARQGAASLAGGRGVSACWRKNMSQARNDDGNAAIATGFVGLAGPDGLARSQSRARAETLQVLAGSDLEKADCC